MIQSKYLSVWMIDSLDVIWLLEAGAKNGIVAYDEELQRVLDKSC